MSYIIQGCKGCDSWSIYQGGIHIFTGSKQARLRLPRPTRFSLIMTIYRVKYYDQAGNGWTREITALDVRGAIKAALIDP